MIDFYLIISESFIDASGTKRSVLGRCACLRISHLFRLLFCFRLSMMLTHFTFLHPVHKAGTGG